MPKKVGKYADSYADEAGLTKEKTAQNAPRARKGKAPEDPQADGLRIRPDAHNYRKHPEFNRKLIKRSLQENGAGRSIVVDNTGESIGGSGVLEQADALGLPKRIVETDGSELVVVVRKDISPDDPRRKQLALADNATTDQSEWDVEALQRDWTADELEEWGVDGMFEEAPGDGDDNPYTMKTDIPQYVPTGDGAALAECLDTEKTDSLIAEIRESGVTPEEKKFLIEAAKRHSVFNYKKIAEYYAAATPEMQRLMERSALVLIDINDAIKNGFVVLSSEIEKILEEDYANANEG